MEGSLLRCGRIQQLACPSFNNLANIYLLFTKVSRKNIVRVDRSYYYYARAPAAQPAATAINWFFSTHVATINDDVALRLGTQGLIEVN